MAKIGDVVRMIEGHPPYTTDGVVGRVVLVDEDGDLWADFANMGNPDGSFKVGERGSNRSDPLSGPTVWCVGKDNYAMVSEADSIDTTWLRDDFAGQAMQGLIVHASHSFDAPAGAKYIAETAYHLADAMLAARGRS